MRLIMENWRSYSTQLNEDRKFQLIIENIENAKTQEEADLVVENWIKEQESILNEIEALKKGREFIDRKLNDFLVSLYFKGANIIEKLLTVGFRVLRPAVKILSFISGKLSRALDRFPLISKIAKASLLALVLLCATSALSVAYAKDPDPETVKSMLSVIDTLQGIMADKLGDIGNIPGATDILSTEDKELKAMYADGINALQDMVSQVKAGKIKDVNDIVKNSGESKNVIKGSLKFVKGLLNNPPEGDRASVDVALDKWKTAGKAIENAMYKYESYKIDQGGGNVTMGSTEKYGFAGPGFPKKN